MPSHLRSILTGFASAAVLSAAWTSVGYAETRTEARAASGAVTVLTANEQALAAFGLVEGGDASWDTMDQRGDVYTFTNFVLASKEGSFTAERLVMEGPEITGDGPVFDRLEVTNLGNRGDETGTLAIRRVEVVSPSVEIAEAFAAILQGREPAEAEDGAPTGTFDAINLEGLTITFEDEDGDSGLLTVGDISAGPLTEDSLASLAMSNMQFGAVTADGMDIEMTLGRVGVTGLSVGTLDAYSQADLTMEGPSSPLNIPTEMDSYDRVEVMGLMVDAGGIKVAMPELFAELNETSDGLVGLSRMPSLTVGADPEGGEEAAQLAGILAGLGYDQLVFSAVGESVYNEDADRFETRGENYFRLEDGVEIRSEQAVTGVKAYLDALSNNLEGVETEDEVNAATMEAIQSLVVERFIISIEDQSLLERSFALAAEMQGQTPEGMRMQAAGMAALLPAFAGQYLPPELTSQLQMALTAFLNQGGTLTIAMEPGSSLSVGNMVLQGMMGDISEFGLTVSHEAP